MEQPKTLADVIKTAEELGASCLPFAYLQDRSGKEGLPSLPLLPLDTLAARLQAVYPATEVTVRIRAVGAAGWACQAQHNTGMPAPTQHAAPAPVPSPSPSPPPVDELATLRAQVAALQQAAATPQTVSVMPSSPLNGAMEILNVASALAAKLNPPPPPAIDPLAEIDRIEKIAARIGAGKTEKIQMWETLAPLAIAFGDRFLSTIDAAVAARRQPQPAPQAPPSSESAPPQAATTLLDTGVVTGRHLEPGEAAAAPTAAQEKAA